MGGLITDATSSLLITVVRGKVNALKLLVISSITSSFFYSFSSAIMAKRI